MNGRAPRSSISWDSDQCCIECREKSLFARLIVGYLLNRSGAGDRYTVDFLFQDRNAKNGDGFPESLHIRICFVSLEDAEYWVKNRMEQAALSLFVKNEFQERYLDADSQLFKDIHAVLWFFGEHIKEVREHIEEMKTEPLPDTGGRETLQ